MTTIPNSIGSVKARKWHRLTRPWVNHLVACASGMPMTTALVASDDSLLLGPLEEAAASRVLGDLLLAWQTGMRQPLPIAVKTAFAWLAQTDRPKLTPLPARPMKATARPLTASAAKARHSLGNSPTTML